MGKPLDKLLWRPCDFYHSIDVIVLKMDLIHLENRHYRHFLAVCQFYLECPLKRRVYAGGGKLIPYHIPCYSLYGICLLIAHAITPADPFILRLCQALNCKRMAVWLKALGIVWEHIPCKEPLQII